MRRRAVAVAALALVLVAGGAVAASGGIAIPGSTGGSSTPAPSNAPRTTSTAVVERRTVETAADLSGTLGYEGSTTIAAGAPGTVTRLPEAGRIITRGQPLYELDGSLRPRLLYGERPLWRTMAAGMSDGSDVLQLERNLKAMGYAPKGMKVNRHWDANTTRAVKRWQKATGRTRDGSLDGADLAFLPGPVRVAATQAALGSRVGPGTPVLGVSTAKRVVTLDISAGRQDLAKPGQRVTLELPDGTEVPGAVRSIGRVATPGANGAPTTVKVTIDVAPGATLPDYDAAPVTVHVVTESHPDVLAVPVNALVALLEGGYAVEVVAADGSRGYVRVKTDLFEDGMVEVKGDGLAAGDTVVVPR